MAIMKMMGHLNSLKSAFLLYCLVILTDLYIGLPFEVEIFFDNENSLNYDYETSDNKVCIPNMELMPVKWQPPPTVHFPYSTLPWNNSEQSLSNQAVTSGLEEMATFFSEKPQRIKELKENSVEAFMNMAYGSAKSPKFEKRSLELALTNLNIFAPQDLSIRGVELTCENSFHYFNFSSYPYELARRLPEYESPQLIREALDNQTNIIMRRCRDLNMLLGFDYTEVLSNPNAENKIMMKSVMWAVNLIGALSNAELKLPPGVPEYINKLWHYLSTYKVPLAHNSEGGIKNKAVQRGAYLMTHIAYIITGYGRHAIYVDDAPWLYHYIRENYYAVLESKGLDLFAEFVDTLRQYGCTEETDAQVRHGSRYLLDLYNKAGQKWLQYRGPNEEEPISDVNMLHKPWTGIAGLKHRSFEPLISGSFGATFRNVIKT